MKGIVLAGGNATRLFPLTATTSKQLLPIYDRQMIFYPLNTLIKAGIKDILVILAPDHSGQFVNLLGSLFDKFGIHLTFKVQKAPRGLADAFLVGEAFIDGDDAALILGDNIFDHDFHDDISSFKSGALNFVKEVHDPECYGVVEFDEGMKVISIEEKPSKPKSNYASVGMYVYDSSVVEVAKNLAPSARGEIEINGEPSVNNTYMKKGELKVKIIEGIWEDAGTFESLCRASQIVRDQGIYKKFDPLIDEAIQQFNQELKKVVSKRIL